MKKLISALILVLSPVAFAQESADGIRLFSVKQAEFAPEHITSFASGSVEIDYDNGLVRLSVSKPLPCTAQKICTRILPRPLIVELPISSVTEGHCGIRHVVATQDNRELNGTLQSISISDTSDLICRSLARFHSRAEYETQALNVESGEQMTAKSVMLLEETSNELDAE